MVKKQSRSRRIASAGRRKIRKVITRVRNSDIVTSTVNDVVTTVKTALTDTNFLISIVLAGFLYYQHKSDDNVVLKFLNDHQDDTQLATWALNNFEKVMGFAYFLPVLLKVPEKIRYMTLTVIGAAVMIFPTLELWVYFFAALVLFLYIKCRSKSTKLIIAVCFGFYLYYVVTFQKKHLYSVENVLRTTFPPRPAPAPAPSLSNTFGNKPK